MNSSKKYSQFRALWAITVASTRAALKNPSGLFFGFLFPIIFISVFGLVGNNSNTTVKIAITQNSDLENKVYEALKANNNVKIETSKPQSEIEDDLKKGRIDAIVSLNKDTASEGIKSEVITSTSSLQGGSLVNSIIQGITGSLNLQSANLKVIPYSAQTREISGRKYTSIDFLLPGQLGFSLLSMGVFGTAFVFMNLRQTLVLKRFFATPVRKINIVLGEGISKLVYAMIQATVIITFGVLVFNFTMVNGVSTFLTMLGLSALGLIVFLGFGFIVSSLAKDENTVAPIANIVTLPQMILSGTFFSTTNFPEWLTYASKALPLTHLNTAFRKAAFDGASLVDLMPEIGFLILSGVVIYVVAIRLFKWE